MIQKFQFTDFSNSENKFLVKELDHDPINDAIDKIVSDHLKSSLEEEVINEDIQEVKEQEEQVDVQENETSIDIDFIKKDEYQKGYSKAKEEADVEIEQLKNLLNFQDKLLNELKNLESSLSSYKVTLVEELASVIKSFLKKIYRKLPVNFEEMIIAEISAIIKQAEMNSIKIKSNNNTKLLLQDSLPELSFLVDEQLLDGEIELNWDEVKVSYLNSDIDKAIEEIFNF